MVGLATTVRRQKRLVAITVAVIVLALVLALWWFQPQKLLIDQRMDEALPGVPEASAEEDGVAAGSSAADLDTLAQGEFRGLDHSSSGRAVLLALADGSQVLRFEDLETDNGPDLRVYLSTAPADGPDDAFAVDFVDLGPLKGNVGNRTTNCLPASKAISIRAR